MMKQYGIVPLEAYNGIRSGQPFHDHKKMVEEMRNYLNFVKTSNQWNSDQVTSTIKSIMNFYIGEPPASVTVA
jgi:bleomycin hydrolase